MIISKKIKDTMRLLAKTFLFFVGIIISFNGCSQSSSEISKNNNNYECVCLNNATKNEHITYMFDNKLYAYCTDSTENSYNSKIYCVKDNTLLSDEIQIDGSVINVFFNNIKKEQYYLKKLDDGYCIEILSDIGTKSIEYSNNTIIQSISGSINGLLYVLYTKASDLKSSIDIYDSECKLINTVSLTDILSEYRSSVFSNLIIDDFDNIYLIGSNLNLNTKKNDNVFMVKLSNKFDMEFKIDLNDIGDIVNNVFLIDSFIVVSGNDDMSTYINYINISSGTVDNRINIDGINKIFLGENNEVIYQKNNRIYNIDGDEKLVFDKEILTTNYNNDCLEIFSMNNISTSKIEVYSKNGNIDSEIILSPLFNSDLRVHGLYVNNTSIYILTSDSDKRLSLHKYENEKESSIELPNLDLDNDEFIKQFIVDNRNNVFIVCDKSIKLYNAIQSEFIELTNDEYGIANSIINDNSNIYISYYNNNEVLLCIFNYSNNTIDTVCSFENSSSVNIYQILNDKLLLGDDKNIYSLELKTNNLNKIISLEDINFYSYIDSINCDENIFYGYEESYGLFRINEQDSMQNTIVVAGFGIGEDVKLFLNDFDERKDEYKIEIKDYLKNNNDGMKKFNLDIASGNIPDIIISHSTADLSFYASKGLFMDLSTYLDKEFGIDRKEYINSVINMGCIDGKMYTLIPQFYFVTILADQTLVDNNSWKYEDLFLYKTDRDFNFRNIRQEDMLKYFISVSENRFIDYKNKNTDFDNDDFKKILNYCKENGADTDDEFDYRDNKYVFEIRTIPNFVYYNAVEKGIIGKKLALKGVSFSGNDNIAIIYRNGFSISEKSKHKEEALEIVREFLLDDYQDSLTNEVSVGFPVKKSSLEKASDYAQNSDGEMIQVWPVKDEMVDIGLISDDTINMLTETINNCSLKYNVDLTINSIVSEEALNYFNEEKSLEEVINSIQLKTKIYINELG